MHSIVQPLTGVQPQGVQPGTARGYSQECNLSDCTACQGVQPRTASVGTASYSLRGYSHVQPQAVQPIRGYSLVQPRGGGEGAGVQPVRGCSLSRYWLMA